MLKPSDPERKQKARKVFQRYLWDIVEFWSLVDMEEGGQRERIAGAVFSIIAAIDGESSAVPPFLLVPVSTEGDEWSFQWRGAGDISGGRLHKKFLERDPRKRVEEDNRHGDKSLPRKRRSAAPIDARGAREKAGSTED
jgi:hypothetical protein